MSHAQGAISMNKAKPIRVFWSPLSRRFYATKAYKEVIGHPGIVECTGERYDVTNDIANVIIREQIEFTERKPNDQP